MPYFDGSDGTRLFYTEWGTGAPVVFLAGAWLSSRSWEYQMLPLSAHARCIAYDRRGHGESDWVGHGYDYDTLADDLAALLEHLDLRDVTLVAHSMAGGEAIRYLSRHGDDRIARLALIATTLPFPAKTPDNPEGVDKAIADAVNLQRSLDRPRWMAQNAQAFFATHLGSQVSGELIEWTIQQCLNCSAKAAFETQEAIFTTDFRAELPKVEVPALVIQGTADVSADVDLCGRRIKDLLNDCVYREYPNVGHGIMLSHAEQLNADLLEWIRR